MTDQNDLEYEPPRIANRFRSFLPVVVDVETGGFNPTTDALLEIAAVLVRMDEDGRLYRSQTFRYHVAPFEGANIEQAALDVTGIDPDHPLRPAMKENDALGRLFKPIRAEIKETGCTRAILVGHNSWFDLQFMNAAVERAGIKRNPFHPFSSFDTATLGGVAFGQTVLQRAAKAAGMSWDEKAAHSAAYDAEQTAELFCDIVNRFQNVYEEAVGGD